ncbi:uncharacterized protein LOC123680220 [Harmonia axyridis]|uniref:uncharacterized protein LOC123680220 n=1 Tax=Harmonia axyridis TaxID=115357 RepID=UPI001E2792D4|nr:uncharacterized protein LOC123680220 [Harmonia axyridis]
MCISSLCFFPSQRLKDIQPRNQEETVKGPDMSNGSLHSEDSNEDFAVTTNENKDDIPEPIEDDDEEDLASQKSTKSSDRISLTGKKYERRSDSKRTSSANALTSKSDTTPVRKSNLRKASMDSKASMESQRRFVSISSESSVLTAMNRNVPRRIVNLDGKGNNNASKTTLPPKDQSQEDTQSAKRRASVDSKGRRVSFQEEVKVRVFDANDRRPSAAKKPPQDIDNIDTLTEEVSERILPKQPKDAPVPSLEELCNTLAFADDIIGEEKEKRRATTSRGRTPLQLPVDPAEFENTFDEMDLFMRRNYPKYYYFLRSQIVTADPNSESYRSQELEFKEAIVACKQHPEEYLKELEKTMCYYDKMSSGPHQE